MTLGTLLATIILVTFIVTVVLAIGSYAAYKMRERRRPAAERLDAEGPVFFERFFPAGASPAHDGGAPDARAG